MPIRTAIELYTEAELHRLREEWPRLLKAIAAAPLVTWEDWKEALLGEVASPVEEHVVRGALAALVKSAPHKMADEVLRDMIKLSYGTVRLARSFSGETDMP